MAESELHRLNRAYTSALEDHIADLESRLALRYEGVSQARGPTCSQDESHREHPAGRSHSVADLVGFVGNPDGPSYIGSSSGYSLATNLGDMVQATTWSKALWIPTEAGHPSEPNGDSAPGDKTFGDTPTRRITIAELQNNAGEPPSDALGSRLIEAYLVRIHPRFPLLVRSDLWSYHRRRYSLGDASPRSKEDGFAVFVLYMVYAIGALTLRLTDGHTDTPPESFYVSALRYVSSAKEASPIHNVEAMVLLILYHFRSESYYGLWHMTGLAMRTVTDLGLHRHASTHDLPPLVAQLRRRLFWVVYTLEGILASTLGRPISLADCDIDQPLPLSINDDNLTGGGGAFELVPESGKEAYLYTNMTQAIMLFQLRRLESRIQRTIYRVDRTIDSRLPKLQRLYSELQAWHTNIPPAVKVSELDRPLLSYHKTMRVLIQPFLTLIGPDNPYFRKCVVSVGEICQIHKRLHQTPEYGHSFIAVHTVFIAGITLLYCLWLGREKVWSFSVSNNLRACSCVLSIMGERAPWVRRYRDVYEVLVEATMAALETDQLHNAREHRHTSTGRAAISLEGLEVLDDGAWNMAQEMASWASG